MPALSPVSAYLGQTSFGKMRRWVRDLPGQKSSLWGLFSRACGLFPPCRSISVWWQRGVGLGLEKQQAARVSDRAGSSQEGPGERTAGKYDLCLGFFCLPAPGSLGLDEYLTPPPVGVFPP